MIDCVQLTGRDLKEDKSFRAELARLCAHAADLLPGASEATPSWAAYAEGVFFDALTEALLEVEVLKPEWAAEDERLNELDQAA